MYDYPLDNVEKLAKKDARYKKQLKSNLKQAGWFEGRSMDVPYIGSYPYGIPDNVLKLCHEFSGLVIEGSGERRVYFEFDTDSLHEDFDTDPENDFYYDYEFSLVLGKQIVCVGRDKYYNRICLDQHFNFYLIVEGSIHLFSRRSFYEGLSNFIYNANINSMRYVVGAKYYLEDYLRDKEGNLLWMNRFNNKDEDGNYIYFTVEL